MKVFIVTCDYSDMEKHINEYCDCFLDEVKAYQHALSLSNEEMLKTFHVIEKEFND